MSATQESALHQAPNAAASVVHDRSIGDIIASTRNLTAEQVERIAEHQRKTGVRFGEAAIALGFANADDVHWRSNSTTPTRPKRNATPAPSW